MELIKEFQEQFALNGYTKKDAIIALLIGAVIGLVIDLAVVVTDLGIF